MLTFKRIISFPNNGYLTVVFLSDSTQTAAPLVELPGGTNTFTCFPPENGSSKVIFSQANNPDLMAVVLLMFPDLKLTALKEKQLFLKDRKLTLVLNC